MTDQTVCSYDFRHPARVNKDQLRMLENLHDNFARLLSHTLSGVMRTTVDVDTAFVDQTTYREFIVSLSNPSCSYQFDLRPTRGRAIIDIAMPLVFGTVDRAFGGKGSGRGVDARQMSQVEMAVMARVLKRMVADLESTWQPLLPVEIAAIELDTNPEFLQITAAAEIVVLLAFQVQSQDMSGLISLCYPFFTLESILPLLSPASYARQDRAGLPALKSENMKRLGNTTVPLRAEFAHGRIAVAEAQSVQVGDVLTMDTGPSEAAVIYVGEKPKMLGVPFVNEQGRHAVKIAEVLTPAQEEEHKNRGQMVLPLPQ